MPRTPKPRFSQTRDALSQYQAVAASFKSWKPASEVLTSVEAVPTIFPQVDVATRIMGWPASRLTVVHGPSNEGKTTLCIGLMLSFLMKGHFAGFGDAEKTTPAPWLKDLMGDYLTHPAFSALPISNYEQTVDSVREYCEGIANAREKGIIPQETTGIVAIDSIRKLTPKKLLETLFNEGATGKTKSKGVDGFGGRAGQIKAALNAAWVDELIPLLSDTRMSMIVVARETDNDDANNFFAEDFKVGGGKALNYDSSIRCRIQRTFIKDETDPKKILGERHRFEIHKTKVGKKESKVPVAFFHTSNGVAAPAGFDRARDVLELALQVGVVSLTGASYKFGDTALGRGAVTVLKSLREDPDTLAEIEVASRNKAAESW